MSPATIPIVQSARAALNERNQEILLWRREELRRAGYGPEAADLLAASPDIDLDLAVELRVRRLRAA